MKTYGAACNPSWAFHCGPAGGECRGEREGAGVRSSGGLLKAMLAALGNPPCAGDLGRGDDHGQGRRTGRGSRCILRDPGALLRLALDQFQFSASS